MDNESKEKLIATPTENSEWEGKIGQEEARAKGEALLDLIAELYTLIEWSEKEELGDPYMKLTFYKSGRFTLENYKEDTVDEFSLSEAEEQRDSE